MSTESQSNNKRIAKNTVMLYFRSILLLVITLYISRVVLKALGEEDFGVYSLIGGIVAMFNMIGATLTTASQRFITFSLGKGDFNVLKKVFTNSMTLHLILGIIVVILLEVCGYWLIYNQLNIPEHRIGAAYIVLQCSILTFFVKIISIPFDALIIAHEKMSAFAYISLLEGIFRLLAAYILIYYGYDKLILHAFLQLGVSVIQRFIYSAYSHHKFPESKNIKLTIDTEVFRQMFSFTSWNFFGQASSIIRTHGIDIILNLFFGVTINAAKGVCNQVQHGVTQLTSNFQTAIRPQLTKAIAIGDDARTYDLIIQGTRFSFYLMTIMSIIIMVYCQEILSLWLEDVPYFAVEFAQLTLIFLLLDAQSRFLMHSMLSKGDIKEYLSVISITRVLVIPVTYIVLKLGGTPLTGIWANIFIEVICLAERIYYNKKVIGLPVGRFVRAALLECYVVFIIAFILVFLIYRYVNCSIYVNVIFSLLVMILVIFICGFKSSERKMIYSRILRQIRKKSNL